ncbi:MAG: CheR family methyltransferase [Polyangiales bacterium]
MDEDEVAEALRARFGIDPRGSSALSARFQIALRENPGDVRDPRWLSSIADRLRVGETRFHRDGAQLDALVDRVLAPALDRGSCRVLSAGCSTGEEAYTLAGLLHAAIAKKPSRAGARWEVVGVDASAASIETARRGRYERPTDLPPDLRKLFVDGSIAPAIAARCRFLEGDLLDADLPRKLGKFDAIVCRNVLIYFRDEQALAVVARLASCLSSEGRLLVARAEVPLVRRSKLHVESSPRSPDVVLFRNEPIVAPPKVAEEPAPLSRVRLIVGPHDRGASIASQGSVLLSRGAPVVELVIVGAVDEARANDLGPALRRLAAAARALGARVAAGDPHTLEALRRLSVT